MKKILLVMFLFFSCANESYTTLDYDGMYYLLSNDFDRRVIYLESNIKRNIKALSNAKHPNYENIKKYDSLTKNYVKFLTNTQMKTLNQKNSAINPFYHNNQETEMGKDYILRTEEYVKEVNELVDLFTLKSSFIELIDYSYLITKEGKKVKNLHYYFSEIPNLAISTYLHNKKRNVLEIENEYLTESLIADFTNRVTYDLIEFGKKLD